MTEKNRNLIRERNLNKLRNALRQEKAASKPRLAELTGLSVVTVNTLIQALLKRGEVLEDVVLSSSGGRPAASFQFNSEFCLALVIYMCEQEGKDTAFFSVVNLYGGTIEQMEQSIPCVAKESFLPWIEALIQRYPAIGIIGFGIPGEEVDQKLLVSDYQGLKDEFLACYMSAKFHLPVFVENDINAAVVGYCYSQGISPEQSVIGIYFPEKYPPGAGIYLNGNLYKGRDGLAGEIKYLPFGIDWENFDYEKRRIEEIAIKTIKSFHCMYNPDRIVLYGKGIRPSILEKIEKSCGSPVESILVPELIVSENMKSDFETGIKRIALKKLKQREGI